MKIKYQPWRQARLQAMLDHQLWGASKLKSFARWFFECRIKLFPRVGKPIATRFNLRILGIEVSGSEHRLCKLFKRKGYEIARPGYVITACPKCAKPEATQSLSVSTLQNHVHCDKCGDYPARELWHDFVEQR